METKLTKKALALFFVLINITVFSQETNSKFKKVQDLEGVEEYLYRPNGLKLLLLKDNTTPVVNVQIVYRVGSRHEVSGNTGSTHLLEHLMFKGTKKFNKKKGTSISNLLNNIGARMNATTWNDRTNYYETIPSDHIELALEIEADRMRNSLLLKEDKEAEMTVVRNEFERGENNPNSVLSKEVWATAYMAHTYHHSTIGWRSDIEKMPIEVLHDFYNTYYWPDNATLTVIGDFQKEQLFNMVDKHFGKITKAPHEMPQPYTEEPPQYGPRKVVVKKQGNVGVILLGYKIPGRMHEDLPALTVLGQLIGSGTSSLLNREFIDRQKAFYGYASPSKFQENGLFTIGLGISPSSDFEAINKELLETLETIKKEGVAQADVNRVISKLNAQAILSRDGFGSIASQINEAIAGGDWRDYVKGSERLAEVTADDVKRVANQYLVEDQSTTGYFIPRTSSGSGTGAQGASPFVVPETGKYHYRDPGSETFEPRSNSYVIRGVSEPPADTKQQYDRKQVNGIDVVSVKTGAKDFVTVVGSFPVGSYFNIKGNEVIPTLTAQMLSKGTIKNDKFAFSKKLEELGVSINVSAKGQDIEVKFKCVKKDVDKVISLLAEQLRYPLFAEKELEILKTQIVGNMQRNLSDPGTLGSIALAQAIYPEGHPNNRKSIKVSIEDVKSATIDEIKSFHKTYFGPSEMYLVAVGDVDSKALHKSIKKAFSGWTGGAKGTMKYTEPQKKKGDTQVITIPNKPSAELFIGQYTGLKRTDADFIPFFIGNYTLGGGFSGRLMQTVRDNDGLTYQIGTRHSGHEYSGGHWSLNASFNPTLFQKGLDATMVQLNKWVEMGITEQELKSKKTNLTGSYKVGLSSTQGLANAILTFVRRGLPPSYVEQYPKDIEEVTLDQVNSAIKKHIVPARMIIIKSGSLDEAGNPLEQ